MPGGGLVEEGAIHSGNFILAFGTFLDSVCHFESMSTIFDKSFSQDIAVALIG